MGRAKEGRAEMAGLLGAVPLFTGCSKRELLLLAEIAETKDYEPEAVLCRTGDTDLGLSLLTQGTVRVVVGGEMRARLSEGDFFGEIALLDGGPRTADVIAETEVSCIEVPSWGFRSVLKSEPSVALKMLEAVCRRIRESQEPLASD